MAHDVFISHSSTDKTVADAVCAALENAEIRCWIAPRDVQPGRSFAGEITRAIQQSEIMVLIFSARSNASEQVLREVQLAVNSRLHIIQFRIEDVHLNDDLRYFLSTPHWLDALTPPLEAHIGRLTASIKTLLSQPEVPAETTPRTPRIARKSPPQVSDRSEADTVGVRWLNKAQQLWQERNPFVLAGAGLLFVLAIWWIAHPRHKTVPYPIAQNPLPSNPFSSSSASPQFTPADSAGESPTPAMTVPPQLTEYLRDPLNIPVSPGDAIPVSKRFILQHEAKVNAAGFSPDTKRIITGSDDKTAIVWDAQTGKQIGSALPHSAAVTAARFSPNGRQIITVDWAVHVWDAETHKESGHPFPAKGLTSATFSPDGRRVATLQPGSASDEYLVRVWDIDGRELLKKPILAKIDMYQPVVSFSPDGKRLVTSSNEKAARIWNAETGEPIGDLLRQKSWLSAASFSPDGKIVATWGSDTKARLWNANTGEQLFELDSTPGYYISSIPFSPDGKFIAAIKSQNYPGQLFDVQTGKKHGVEMPFPHPPSVFSPDSKWFATVSYQDDVWLWDVATTRVLNKDIKHDGSINAMNFSPDGKLLVTASEDQTARVWQIGGAAPASTPIAATPKELSAPIQSMSPNPFTQQPTPFTQETATSLAERLVSGMSAGGIDSVVALYADRVDCLDRGVIGQDGVRDGYQKFFERWPQTTWRLTGPVKMQPADQGKYRLTFPIYFVAANLASNKQTTGNAEETLVVAPDLSGDWKIIYQRETILRSAKTRQQAVVGKPVKSAPYSTPSTSNPADQERQRQAAEEIARRLQSLIPH